jgi:hypothetical protein
MSNTKSGAVRPRRPAPAPAAPQNFRARHPMLTTLIPVALVLVAIVTMIVVKVSSSPGSTLASNPTGSGGHATAATDGTTALPAGVFSAVSSVTPATEAAVGRPAALPLPAKVSGHPALLTGAGGKPEILYVGAEYCPYCAAERWAVVEALSRFGTFAHLSATHSSSTDIYPDTRTFSFYGSTYTSPYLSFVPVEEYTNQPDGGGYTTLQTPTAAENGDLADFDATPYTSDPGSIPFLSIGNRYLFIGASYNPQILQGLSMQAIAAQLEKPSSAVAMSIDGTANEITASICAITGNQPAVCDTPTISAIASTLGA